MSTLEELIHDIAQRSIDQQERLMSDLRQRAGTLIAAASLTGSVFAAVTIDRVGLTGWAIAGMTGLGLTLLLGLVILLPHRLVFVLDPDQLYRELWEDRDSLDVAHRRLADVLWRARRRNFRPIQRLHWLFALGVVVLALELVLWGVALAVG